jgi:hypothetical protein
VQLALASVPEPSFIIYGQVESSGVQVKQPGMVVSVRHGDTRLAESILTAANNFEYTLEVPLEASIGSRGSYAARVGDLLQLQIAGQTVDEIPVSERGLSQSVLLTLKGDIDSDGDGIFDALEIDDGKNPNDPNDPVKFGNLDIDNDGISNGLEFLSNTYDPYADYDGDGYSNQDEYELGFDPASSSKFPALVLPFGKYAALHAHQDSITYYKSETDQVFTWNEELNGKPVSIVGVYWNIDRFQDLLISTDQGKAFVITSNEANKLSTPKLIILDEVASGSSLQVGFANIDGINTEEMWVFSPSVNKIYFYQRQPKGQPFGQLKWFDVGVSNIMGNISIHDLDKDGAVDLIATGVDVSAPEGTPVQTLVKMKGRWDGYNQGFDAPLLLSQHDYIDNSHIQVIPNILEVGFDRDADILIKDKNQKIVINPSFNSYYTATKTDLISQRLVTHKISDQASPLFIQGVELNNENTHTPFLFADFNRDGQADLLQYMGNSTENSFQFKLVLGVKNTLDSDGDGVFDYKDINPLDENKPMPNGNQDFDFDGVPYGIDSNHSGQEDSDGDKIPDAYELQNRLSPLSAVDGDATSDADQDGRTNYQEYMDGTDPQSRTSVATFDAQLITTLNAFKSGTSDMVIAGQELAVSSQMNKSVKLYNLNNQGQVRTLESSDSNGVSKMVTTENLIVMGNMGGSVEIWDVNSGSRLASFNQNNSSVTDLAIDGINLYVLHADGHVFRFNVETLTYVASWFVYEGFLTSLMARNNILYIQASSPEKIMFVWNASTQEQIYTIAGSGECCEKVVAEISGNTLVLANSYSGSGIFATNISNFNTQQVVPQIDVSAVRSINTSIYVGRKSGVIEKYSSIDGSFQSRVAAPYSQVREIELINGGFISLHADGNVYIWDDK